MSLWLPTVTWGQSVPGWWSRVSVLTRCPRVCGLRVPHTPPGRLLPTLCGGGGLLRGCVPLCVWVQGAVGSGFPSLFQLSFCFLGQNVTWPRWLQGQAFCFCFFGKLCCRLLFFFFKSFCAVVFFFPWNNF